MAPLYPYLIAFTGMAWEELGRRCEYERIKHDTLVRLLELFAINLTILPIPGFIVWLYVRVNMEPIISGYW